MAGGYNCDQCEAEPQRVQQNEGDTPRKHSVSENGEHHAGWEIDREDVVSVKSPDDPMQWSMIAKERF